MAHRTIHRVAIAALLTATSLGCSESHVGSGDAGIPVDSFLSLADSGPDAGAPPSTCAAMDARTAVCPASTCDGPPTFFWDGSRCFAIGCGECEGADCERGVSSPAECESAHASCDATLCRATSGDWLGSDLYCGHHLCGVPAPAICESGTPACNCGAARNFVPGTGCVTDPACPAPDPDVSREALCGSTGGTWADTCCPSTCGVPCGAECLAPACTCGALQVWNELTGCTDSSMCLERQAGEVCTSGTRCADGLLCCQQCGGDGCAPDATCEPPVCDDDPNVDTCGNNLLAP